MEGYQKRNILLEDKYVKLIHVKLCNDEAVKNKQQ